MVDYGVKNEREESIFRERTRSRLPNEREKMESYYNLESGLPDVNNRLAG